MNDREATASTFRPSHLASYTGSKPSDAVQSLAKGEREPIFSDRVAMPFALVSASPLAVIQLKLDRSQSLYRLTHNIQGTLCETPR